jgi:hypothetical protein
MIPTARVGSTTTRAPRSFPWLALVALLLGAAACQKKAERLLLLDVRVASQLPSTVSAIRFSAMGWPTRSVAGVISPAGLKFGYYGPSGSGPVTVTVQAIDARNCVLGTGSATVLDTLSGQTSPVTVVYVSPLEPTMCLLRDAGFDSGEVDAGADGLEADAAGDAEAGADTRTDLRTDTGTDSRSDARGDGADAAADRFGDARDAAGDTGATRDAGVDAISGPDVGPVTDSGGTGTDAGDASPG